MAQILVNCANAYEKKEVEPELVELAKFAKHHVPEDHEKDLGEFVKQRRQKLLSAGVASALVALTSTTDSENTRELLSRVFRAVAEEESSRGSMVQQGSAKVRCAVFPASICQ